MCVIQVAKSDAANGDPLVDLFCYVEDVFKRLEIYPDVSAIAGGTQILVEMMTELVSVFAHATKDVNDGLLVLSESILIRKLLSNVAFRELSKESTREY